jgi:hypothetical protein
MKKSNSSMKKSNFGVKKRLFFTLANPLMTAEGTVGAPTF